MTAGGAPIRVWTGGRHAHRTPLAYPALRPALAGRIETTDDPARADLYAFAHPADVQAAPKALVLDWRRRRRPVVLLSEEPFWDTIWGGRPLDREVTLDTDWGALPVIQVTHQTSKVFAADPGDPDALPYFLLTDDRYTDRYAALFARNAQAGPAERARADAARPLAAAFLFERRPEPFHDVAWPEADLFGLCAWRTRLAEALVRRMPPGSVACLGRSWQGGDSRFVLEDWHADKLARLDGQARAIGAVENTHQPDYLTEKVFDAFACGALPVVHAGPRHALHRLGLPEAAMVNLHGLDAERAAAALADRLDGPGPDPEACTAAQRRLADLFADPAPLRRRGRDRLGRALAAELASILDAASPGRQ